MGGPDIAPVAGQTLLDRDERHQQDYKQLVDDMALAVFGPARDGGKSKRKKSLLPEETSDGDRRKALMTRRKQLMQRRELAFLHSSKNSSRCCFLLGIASQSQAISSS